MSIKPYYQDSHCTIYRGDCREILPQLEPVDLVLTDPPYGIDYGRAGGFSASHGWNNNREQVEWDVNRVDALLIKQCLDKGKKVVIWGGNYYTDILPPTMRWLIWDKVQRGFSLADCEMAWVNEHKASRIFTYARGNESGFAPALPIGKKGFQNSHPTQKPLSLMLWCINFFPNAQTILDPFMGSGTTLRAAKDLNRKAIGIEIEEKYCQIAVERLRQEVLAL
jgi:DNA modification methylase